MKPVRVLFSLLLAGAMAFAFAFPASAIGFEAEQIYQSVFVVYSGNSMGSGFAIGKNCVVTNAHVIGDAGRIRLTSYAGREYAASLLGMNEEEDIAALAVADADFPYLPLGNLSDVKTGDDIYAIGAPKGMAYTLTKGTVSAKERKIGGRSFIQIDAAINEGNSGGPLLNDAGEVLGMNTLKMTDSEGIGLSIPADRLAAVLKSLGIELNADGSVRSAEEPPETAAASAGDSSSSDENGNLSRADENSASSAAEEGKQQKNGKENVQPAVFYAVVALAALSLLGNVILIILLIYQKKKNLYLKYDPRERTDFDIDLLE